jgi:beta-glucosidase/6-phospho-beta-glucosidase/beta-galactosidase
MRTARDGVRWHLIEQQPYKYDFSSALPMIQAARDAGIQIIWDLCHYGWPDDLDIFSGDFIRRFSSFAGEFARVLAAETQDTPHFSPINEISFFSWAAGDQAILNPFATGRGDELKRHLVRASIAAIDRIRSACPSARFVQVDPVIHVVVDPGMGDREGQAAAAHCRAQFTAWDMLAGLADAALGGAPGYLDIIGVNYYVHNQWVYQGKFIERTDPRYRPFHDILSSVYRRYRRPILIAETGIEDERRPEWFRYICDQVVIALEQGIPVQGVCLYPVLNHPGWDDDRHCRNGLWDYCNECGGREIYSPLADEIMRQQTRIGQLPRTLAHHGEMISAFA